MVGLSNPSMTRVLFLAVCISILTTFTYLHHPSDSLSAAKAFTNKWTGTGTTADPLVDSSSTTSKAPSSGNPEKDAFMETSLKAVIGGKTDLTGLQDMCTKTKWQPGLIFACDDVEGGVGNIINEVLTCVRFAIEAGASLVIPTITARDEKDITDLATTNYVDLDTFFDKEYFLQSLRTNCPQMELINHRNDVKHLEKDITCDPAMLVTNFTHNDHVMAQMETWRGAYDDWQNQIIEMKDAWQPTAKTPLLVNFARAILRWPVKYDPPEFYRHFSRILPFRKDIRRIGAAVLWELDQRYDLDLDPSQGIIQDGFFGAHLRTEVDAVKAGYMSYDDQEKAYLEQAEEAKLRVIYVASADAEGLQKFKTVAWEQHGYNITTKYDLLTGKDREAMEALSWDQQGIIDWEVLMRSSSLGGIAQSSFTWNIALQRHLESTRDDYVDGPRGQTMSDEFSIVYGLVNIWAFFHGGMWP